MSGKRILDAIALLRVTRNVAANHFAIRFSQVNLYTKTSSLVKAIQGRTAPGFAAPSQAFSQSSSHAARGPIPDPQSVVSSNSQTHDEGLEQDHHYDRSREHSVRDKAPSGNLEVKQARADREPLPDGTIPPANSPIGSEEGDPETSNVRPTTEPSQHPVSGSNQGELKPASSQASTTPVPKNPSMSSEEAMQSQRQSEEQIPNTSADPPKGGSPDGNESGFAVAQDQDVFYQPEGRSSPVLSALPRVKVPKTENDFQGGDSHIPKNINADVYYSGTEKNEMKKDESNDEPDEEMLSRLFHTKRASQLLRKAPGKGPSRSFHTNARMYQQTNSEQEDLKKLAQDMAKDVQTGNVSLSTWYTQIKADLQTN